MIPFDQQALKLRLLADRAHRKMKAAEEVVQRAQRQMNRIRYNEYEPAWMAYQAYVREMGYCACCELPLTECQCIAMAAMESMPS